MKMVKQSFDLNSSCNCVEIECPKIFSFIFKRLVIRAKNNPANHKFGSNFYGRRCRRLKR